jgi:ribosome-binding factor A
MSSSATRWNASPSRSNDLCPMSSLRHHRVRELLKRQIGEVLHREISSAEAGLITVTDVGLSDDLKAATVFISVVGDTAQQRKALAVLTRERTRLQNLVARAVVLKYFPRLRFVLDGSIERGNRILAILDELDLPPADSPTS